MEQFEMIIIKMLTAHRLGGLRATNAVCMRDRMAKSAQNLNVTVDERIKCVNYGAIFSGKL